MKKLLLTGSSGFLGKNLKKILDKNYKVITFRSSDYDLCNLTDTKKLFKISNPDIVVNCAAFIGGINFNKKFPYDVLIKNLKIQLNTIEAFNSSKAIKLVNINSACVYSDKKKKPFSENLALKGDMHESVRYYGFSKLLTLYVGEIFKKNTKKKITNIILANLYGIGDNFDQNYSHVIPMAILKIQNAKQKKIKQISFWGSGNETRDFLYISDAVSMISKIIKSSKNLGIINIGSGKGTKISKIVDIICKYFNYAGKINWNQKTNKGSSYKVLNINKVKKNFTWKLNYPLKTGIIKTIKNIVK